MASLEQIAEVMNNAQAEEFENTCFKGEDLTNMCFHCYAEKYKQIGITTSRKTKSGEA